MKTKTAILGSIAWIVLVLVFTVAIILNQGQDPTLSRTQLNQRAQTMGRIAGIVISCGWMCLWLPWAVRRRKERDAARNHRQQREDL